MENYRIFLNGEWVIPEEKELLEDVNPATGEVFASVYMAGEKEVESALSCAYEVRKSWGKSLAKERERILLNAADYMEKNAEKWIPVMIDESGSTYIKIAAEFGSCVDILRTAAGECTHLQGGVIQGEYANHFSYYTRNPLGVVVGIAPFNYPLFLAIDKISFALAMGNAFILKPSSKTPISGLLLAECFENAGLPKGVLSVLPGSGKTVGDKLVNDPRVRMVALTGSSEVGRKLAQQAAASLKKVSLELGGKNPMLVLKDFSVEKAADLSSFGAYFHQGQICMATTRIIVEEPIYDEFCEVFAKKTKEVPMGDPHDKSVIVGPLIEEAHCSYLDELIADAIEKGARLLAGGGHKGAFYEPTLLVDVTPEMRVFHEECFGPVAIVVKAKDEKDGVALCNDNIYGLSSSILTNDINKALNLSGEIEAGMVHINESTIVGSTRAPFGGVKLSGIGRENGQFSADEYTEIKWITVQH